MRLLIVTQKVDKTDDVLGFMHRWIEKFATQCEAVTVICLYQGPHSLPCNVRVFSLGKEMGQSRLAYLYNFFQIIVRERNAYDSVFVHMNQLYVVLGGIFWRVMGKRFALWYAHGHVPATLRIAEKLTHIIFTSTKSGFRLPSAKIQVIGQGIDTDFFKPAQMMHDTDFHISVVGRISPVKDYETLIGAVALVAKDIPHLRVSIVGGVGLPEHEKYLKHLERLVESQELKKIVSFAGSISNTDIVQILQTTDAFVNTSHTGSLDKAVLEAMSCGVPILTCNEAFLGVLGPLQEELFFEKKNVQLLAQKILQLAYKNIESRKQIGDILRSIVIKNHALSGFVNKIITGINGVL